MAFTYSSNPGTATAVQRRDSVRLLIRDTDIDAAEFQDSEIDFFLDQASDDVYKAAALAASSLYGKYARLTDVTFDEVSIKYSNVRDSYKALINDLEAKAVKYGAAALGLPRAGGISHAAMRAARSDSDRVDPAFRIDQFTNPPSDTND